MRALWSRFARLRKKGLQRIFIDKPVMGELYSLNALIAQKPLEMLPAETRDLTSFCRG